MKLRNKEFDEIFEVITFGYVDSKTPNGNGDYPVEFISLEVMDEDGDNYEYRYRSLKDLNAVWEDYKPAEPLIKDEKIRKAVRAWAEINEVSQARTIESCSGAYWYIRAFYIGERRCIDLDIWGEMPRELVSNKYYTIAELCGEEGK